MKREILFGIFFVALIIFTILPLIKADTIIGGNNKNVTIRTYVNITNSKPEVLALVVYQETNVSLMNVTLSAGSTRIVTCNATVRDWNGFNDIKGVNATLWDTTNAQYADPNNNNTHYTNSACTNSSNGLNFTINYICQFSVYYYANNGTWNCTAIATDSYNKTGNKTNSTLFYPMYALNVTDGIDFGNVAIEDYSANKTANITNIGNRQINITVEGYGVNRGDGLAMNCSLGGNIAVSNERFSINDVNWTSMTNLSSTAQNIPGLSIPKQTLPGTLVTNTTHWQLYADSANNPGGNCTGYVIFSAEAY